MSGQLQTITSNYKAFIRDEDVSIGSFSQGFTQCMSVVRKGAVYSVAVRLNTNNAIVKVSIDGIDMFSADLKSLEKIKIGLGGGGSFYSSDDVFIFRPRFPIFFSQSITVSAKANNTSTGRKFTYGIIEYTEE